jgi:hypothetical protein
MFTSAVVSIVVRNTIFRKAPPSVVSGYDSKRAQQISAAAPLRVMASRYNPSSKRAFRVLLLELSLCVYYVINLQCSLLIKFIFGNYVYLYMFRTRIAFINNKT